MELREFTRHDFDAFGGAEAFVDSRPLVATGEFGDGTEWVLVLDRNGACMVCDDEQAPFGGYCLQRKMPFVSQARDFAASLGDPKTRGEFFIAGFTAV